MPIYEYQCDTCGHRLEALQKISDGPLTACPDCNQPNLRKLVSAAGFVLKGTGWYVTDFRDSGKAAAKEKSASGESAAVPSKTESTPSSETSAKPDSAPKAVTETAPKPKPTSESTT